MSGPLAAGTLAAVLAVVGLLFAHRLGIPLDGRRRLLDIAPSAAVAAVLAGYGLLASDCLLSSACATPRILAERPASLVLLP